MKVIKEGNEQRQVELHYRGALPLCAEASQKPGSPRDAVPRNRVPALRDSLRAKEKPRQHCRGADELFRGGVLDPRDRALDQALAAQPRLVSGADRS
jgi:hypothetical protein